MVPFHSSPTGRTDITGDLAGVVVDEGTDYSRRRPWSDDIRRWVLSGYTQESYYPFQIIKLRGERHTRHLVLPNDPIELFPLQDFSGRVGFPGVWKESGQWFASYGKDAPMSHLHPAGAWRLAA